MPGLWAAQVSCLLAESRPLPPLDPARLSYGQSSPDTVSFVAMDSSSVLNVIAVAVAFGALAVSLVFAMTQTRIMRQTNQMPIFIDLIREFRSSEFQEAEQYVLNKLTQENPAHGVLRLPDRARFAASIVVSFFGVLANLVIEDIISEASAVSTLGFRANNLWTKMEPFIMGERNIRGDNDYARYFEDFVCRVRTHWPPEKYYPIPTRRLAELPVNTSLQ
jgi:hypothetical protein